MRRWRRRLRWRRFRRLRLEFGISQDLNNINIPRNRILSSRQMRNVVCDRVSPRRKTTITS
uniref:At1g27100/T7N9_16 n=1 Tax=Arabidopsis thaliana TaxID=3702 RepID=Q94EH7_ARATH|nr:At1g27100/T7N9_16 [Arabidopsis thaliana]